MKNSLRENILNVNFLEANKQVENMDFSKFEDEIIVWAFEDNQDIIFYTFICHLIAKNESEPLHSLACDLLCHPLCHIEGAYKAALYHTQEALHLDPSNIGHKEMLLFLYTCPDLPDELLTREESLETAASILEVDPENQAARSFIKDYKPRKRRRR
ncbi:hypothetical protein [Priestia megaterium]|uniref:hypothetical protein n=1 Tax=Priestia megaterium TaxID=1404 RepID=UPI002FFDA927